MYEYSSRGIDEASRPSWLVRSTSGDSYRDDPLYASILSRRGTDVDQKNTISQAVEAGSGHERHRRVPAAAFGTAFILVLALIGLTYVLRSETSPLVDEPVAETIHRPQLTQRRRQPR